MNTPKIAKWTGVEIKSLNFRVKDIVKETLRVLYKLDWEQLTKIFSSYDKYHGRIYNIIFTKEYQKNIKTV